MRSLRIHPTGEKDQVGTPCNEMHISRLWNRWGIRLLWDLENWKLIRSSDVVFNEDSIFSGRSRLKIGKKVIFYLSNRDSDKNAFFIPLLPGESRRKGLYSYKDPHREQLVEYADKGVVGREAGHMSKTGRTDKAPHAEVKQEFFGKPIPPNGNRTSLEKETKSDGSGRNPVESRVNQK